MLSTIPDRAEEVFAGEAEFWLVGEAFVGFKVGIWMLSGRTLLMVSARGV